MREISILFVEKLVTALFLKQPTNQPINQSINQSMNRLIVHFTAVCLVVKPLNRSEARVDFVLIQTLLLFTCKSLCYHAN